MRLKRPLQRLPSAFASKNPIKSGSFRTSLFTFRFRFPYDDNDLNQTRHREALGGGLVRGYRGLLGGEINGRITKEVYGRKENDADSVGKKAGRELRSEQQGSQAVAGQCCRRGDQGSQEERSVRSPGVG